ncbi:hypothetical protein BD779DRAFT_1695329 [Infundibulicybe gibba]|nr:hypothetical protein BD779DRAFT_1695329 [Infundibulicybe gibba]
MQTAPELKQQGNAFFKSDSADVVYPSNLSAALYEMGDYAASVDAIVRAWRLLSLNSDTQASEPLVQRLSARLAKALCHGARCGTITHAMVNVPANRHAIAELSSRAGTNSIWEEWNTLLDGYGSNDWDEISRQAKVGLSRLPIFRCAVYPITFKPSGDLSFYQIGQDEPMSLLDDWGLQPEHKSPVDLSKFSMSELKELSFLLAGVGDGCPTCILHPVGAKRAYLQLPCSKRDSFQLHITMLDIHPAPLARDLCVMLLLDQLSNIEKDNAIEKAEIMATIFYAYVAVVMPSYCEQRLLSTMKDLIARLANVPPRLPTWMHVNSEAIDPIMKILRFWVDLPSPAVNLEEAIKDPNMSSAFRDAMRHNLDQARQDSLDMLERGTPEELAMLDLTPPPRSASARVKEKDLVPGDEGVHAPEGLWSRHPRFAEFYQQMGLGMRGISGARFAQIISDIKKTWKPNWTLFFESTRMKSRGAEQDEIRWGSQPAPPFPRSFTRIYLSNIPDYTHGIINTAVFALPAVKCKEESLVTASTFLNSTIWKDDAEFIYTYTLLRPSDVERFLGCRFTGQSVVQGLTILGRPLQPPTLTNLASRAELEAWLIRTLIYTLVPGSGGGVPLRVRLPNNVVAFFALLVHLHSTGYPAHWLGELVQRIISSEVTTGVTPYRGRWPIPVSTRVAQALRARFGLIRGLLTSRTSSRWPAGTALPRAPPTRLRGAPGGDLHTGGRHDGLCPDPALPGGRGARDIVGDIPRILEGQCGPPPGEVYILTAMDVVELPRVRWKMGRRRFSMMRKAGWSAVVYRTDVGEPLTAPVPAREWREM